MGAFALLILIGVGIKKAQANGLGLHFYGQYAFFISVTSFVVLFLRFGFFESLRVLLAQNSNPKREKRLLAVGLVLALFCGILLSFVIAFLSFFIDSWFNSEISRYLLIFSPLCTIMPFTFLMTGYSTGSNKILVGSLYELLPKALFVSILWYLFAIKGDQLVGDVRIEQNIFWNLMSTILLSGIIFWSLKPDFSNFRKHLQILLHKNKKFGRHYNLGAIANQTTYRLDEFFITAMLNTNSLGIYNATLFVCSPMMRMSQAVTNSMFKSFADMRAIPAKLFRYNILWLASCVGFLYVTKHWIVYFIFGKEFVDAHMADYIVPMAIALFIHGLAVPYSFLTAKSYGKEIRNVAWAEAISNIIGNFVLIWMFGLIGAIYASMLSRTVHYFMLRYYYQRFKKGIRAA